MGKEPIGLYLIRLISTFFLLFFMGMVYWSSLLIEQDLRSINHEINRLADAIEKQERPETSPEPHQTSFLPKPKLQTTTARRQIDPILPNLLNEDLFYTKTLPNLLGPSFKPSGTMHSSSIGKPDNLHPFANWSDVVGWNRLCVPSAATLEFGKYETMAPQLAIKMEERKRKEGEGKEYWVHLRDDLFWQPVEPGMLPEKIDLSPHFLKQHRVSADDFKFWYDAMMNPFNNEPGALAFRNLYNDVESVEVIDPLTLVVRWKAYPIKQADGSIVYQSKYVAKQLTGALRPLPSFVYKYFPDGAKIIEDDSDPNAYRNNSVWANNFTQHWAKNIIVGCGPWKFDRFTENQISFKRNPHYPYPLDALTEKRETFFKNSWESVWLDFKVGKTEMYNIQPDQMMELETFLKSPLYKKQESEGNKIDRLTYLARSFQYIGWNQAKPYFKAKKVRQALTMAINRERILRQNVNDQGVIITGPFFIHSPSYDQSIAPWPYDPEQARHILEEEGWFDSDGDGIIDKEIDGKRVPFQFRLTYFVKNGLSKSIAEYIATSLKELGIDCILHGVDLADLSAAFDDKTFDALYLGWGLGTPPEDPRQLWYSTGAKEKGSSNAVGFSNPEADQIIDALQYEENQKQRIALYHRLHAILHDEQPYTFLFSPKVLLLYRNRVQNVFIPVDRPDLIPGANIAEPDSSVFWIKEY